MSNEKQIKTEYNVTFQHTNKEDANKTGDYVMHAADAEKEKDKTSIRFEEKRYESKDKDVHKDLSKDKELRREDKDLTLNKDNEIENKNLMLNKDKEMHDKSSGGGIINTIKEKVKDVLSTTSSSSSGDHHQEKSKDKEKDVHMSASVGSDHNKNKDVHMSSDYNKTSDKYGASNAPIGSSGGGVYQQQQHQAPIGGVDIHHQRNEPIIGSSDISHQQQQVPMGSGVGYHQQQQAPIVSGDYQQHQHQHQAPLGGSDYQHQQHQHQAPLGSSDVYHQQQQKASIGGSVHKQEQMPSSGLYKQAPLAQPIQPASGDVHHVGTSDKQFIGSSGYSGATQKTTDKHNLGAEHRDVIYDKQPLVASKEPIIANKGPLVASKEKETGTAHKVDVHGSLYTSGAGSTFKSNEAK